MAGSTTIGNVYIRIGAKTDKLTGDLKKADREIQAFGKKAKEVGSSMTQNITLPIIGVGAGALKAYADLESLQKGLIAVMGSSEAASAEFQKLREVAKLPGLGLEEAARGSVSLQSAGFSADQAREALLQFGNALATVGKGKNELNLVTLALTQLQNKSSGFGQDLRQLLEQLPQMRGALVNAFGTADSEEIAKMGVTGKQVVEQLIAEFSKLPRVTGGLKNAFENASDSIKIAFANLGETLNKNLNIEGFINRIADGITRMSQAFSELSPEAQATIITIAGIAAAAGPVLFVVGQLAGSFSAVIAAMKTAGIATTVAMGPIGWAIAGIVAAIGVLIYKWDDVKETLNQVGLSVDNLSGVWQGLGGFITFVVTLVKTAINGIGNLVGTLFRTQALLRGQMTWETFKTATIAAFEETGKEAAEGFNRSFNDNVKVKLNIAGSTAPGARAASWAKLREGGKPTETGGGVQKESGYTLAEFKKDIAAVDVLVQTGFLSSAEALDEKLKIITSAAKKFAEKGLKPTSKELQTVIELQNQLKTFETLPDDINSGKGITIKAGLAFQEALPDDVADRMAGKDKLTIPATPSFQEIPDDVAVKAGLKDGITVPITADLQKLIDEKKLEEKIAKMATSIKNVLEAMADIGTILNPVLELSGKLLENQMAGLEQKQKKEKAAVEATVLNEDEKGKRLAAIDAKYDKEKKKIQRKQAIAAKASGIFNAIISAFEGAAKALTMGPLAIAMVPYIKALGFAQAAAIAAQPLPSLAVGTNMVKSDGLANIHKGEAIVPAKVVSGGYSGVPNLIQVVGKIAGTDIILGTKNSSELYNRMYA